MNKPPINARSPLSKKRTASTDAIAIKIQNVFDLDFSILPVFIQSAASTGLTNRATNKEEESTIISVIGRNFMNSPIKSFQKSSGTNAATVVAVEAIIAVATSPTPSLDASAGLLPSPRSLYIFSTTTIPLSTSIPSASMRENKTIIFRVLPPKFNIAMPISMDSGIAMPTNNELRRPRKNTSTMTTKSTPMMILFSKLLTMFLVFLLWSFVIVTSRSFGREPF